MKHYTTKSGDMWDSIALRELGSEFYSNQLIDANPKYSDIVTFNAGVLIVIPDLVIENSEVSLPPWRR